MEVLELMLCLEPMSIKELAREIKQFSDERDWGQFHNPKDLSIAISLEASELLEHFLWRNAEQIDARARDHLGAIRHEIADIAIYLLELTDLLGIDLSEAIRDKLKVNEEKYPVARAKGNSRKYNEGNT